MRIGKEIQVRKRPLRSKRGKESVKEQLLGDSSPSSVKKQLLREETVEKKSFKKQLSWKITENPRKSALEEWFKEDMLNIMVVGDPAYRCGNDITYETKPFSGSPRRL